MPTFRRLAYSGIERVAWIESVEECLHCWLGGIEVAHIVLCGILGFALVEQCPHAMLQRQAVMAFAHDIILMEDVAEEMAVVELMNDRIFHVCRKRLEPVPVVAPQGDVKGDDVLHFVSIDGAESYGCSGNSEAMQKGCFTLRISALEESAVGRSEVSSRKPCASSMPLPDILSRRWCSYRSRKSFILLGRWFGKSRLAD